MLNKKQERELAYVVLIDEIKPIEGYDRVEYARTGGWWVIVQKGQFKVGDPAIYFEIDSKVPSDKECFNFLEKRNYRVKTIKMCKVISQGLLMKAEDFGWKTLSAEFSDGTMYIEDDEGKLHFAADETRFLTKKLGVVYATEEDNKRKANSVDKYKKMAQRHPDIFKNKLVRKIMKYKAGRRFMFFFFGKKKKDKYGWPEWVVKTDEERIQNMPWILSDDGCWIVTEKIDGTSTTFTMKRGKHNKNKFYVCSRNVCFDSIDKPCYYDNNVYWEMAKKYNMYDVLSKLLDKFPDIDWVTVQGETYGSNVQKRDYSINEHDFAAFNLITSKQGRFNSIDMKNILEKLNVPCVPIILKEFYFKVDNKVEDILKFAEGNSVIDGKEREGLVFRSEDGSKSFKAVSNSYLLKYHG